jgi:FtsH-binding integral membrane protein
MENWNQKRYVQEKHSFIQQRINLAPLWAQFTLMFAVSWGTAWFCSWFLWHFFAATHSWARSLPILYAISFLFAYGCFFLAVRIWIEVVKQEPHHQNGLSDFSSSTFPGDTEGCFTVIALLAIGFMVSGLFLAIVGTPMLLEAAFEAAFAGIVVSRPIIGNLVLGNWTLRLLKNTWKKALICILVLVAVAAGLQHQVPQASTFAEAVRTILHHVKN